MSATFRVRAGELKTVVEYSLRSSSSCSTSTRPVRVSGGSPRLVDSAVALLLRKAIDLRRDIESGEAGGLLPLLGLLLALSRLGMVCAPSGMALRL